MIMPLRRYRLGLAIAVIGLSACGTQVPSSTASGSVAPVASPSVAPTPVVTPFLSPAPQATRLPQLDGRILFTRAGGQYGDETIFTADANGANERQVIAETCCPRWSPDGAHILVAGLEDGRITTAILDPDGSLVAKVPLPEGDLNLGPGVWGSDGQHMALDGFDDADPAEEGIYFVAIDGSSSTRLTDVRALPVDVTPDGEWVIYFELEPTFPRVGDQLGGRLVRVRVDGTDRTPITPDDLPAENIGLPSARLSHDGESLVFTVGGAIWRIGVDGSEATKIFDDPDGGIAITPTWSPDDDWILFGLDPPGTLATVSEAPPNVLAVVRPDGSGYTEIVTSRDWKREPDWTSGSD